MHLIGIRVSLALALLAAVMGLRSANALDLNQDWVLNSSLSHVYMQTEKLEAVIERQQFKSVEGGVTRDGDATIKLDLASLETGIDLRNVRMRFLLFEVFKYPFAIITAKLDKSKLQYLTDPKAPVKAYPLTLKVNMHGDCKRDPDRGVGRAYQRQHRLGLDGQSHHGDSGKLRAHKEHG